MDLINEKDLNDKLVVPTLDRLENSILPGAITKLEDALRRVLDGADVHITITLKK